MPYNSKRGGTYKNIRNSEYLTEDQAKFIYKKVNTRGDINTETIKHEMEQEKLEKVENAYQKAILSEVSKKEKVSTQKGDWSILSDHVKYVRHDDESETFHNLHINTLNYHENKDVCSELERKEMLKADVDFSGNPEKLKPEYLDVYEGVYAKIVSTNLCNEDTDLSTTYLEKVNMSRNTEVKAEERFPITTRGYTRGEL